MNKHKKGFTLAELLVVVAIIAVLVVIAVPVYKHSTEKAAESTDIANIRNAYAEIMVAALDDSTTTHSITIDLVQKIEDWQDSKCSSALTSLFGEHITGVPGATATVFWNTSGYIEVEFDGEGGGSSVDPGEGPKIYIASNERKEIMTGMAEVFADLRLDNDGFNVSWIGQQYDVNGDDKGTKLYREVHLNSQTLDMKLNNNAEMNTLRKCLESKGIDTSKFSDNDYVGSQACMFFTLDGKEALAVGYFTTDTNSTYNMILLDSGTVIENLSGMRGDSTIRRRMSYNEEYALEYAASHGGIVSKLN